MTTQPLPRRIAELCALLTTLAATAASTGAQSPAQRDGQPDTRPTIAVMYFDNGALLNHADYEPLGRGVADMLITELSANPGVRVVERDHLQKLLDEQGLGATGRVDPATAVRMGKLLGAHYIILGGFVIDPKQRMRLDARAVKTETSEVKYVATVSDKADDMLGMVADLAAKMNSGMDLPPIPLRTDASADGTPRPPAPPRGGRVQFKALMLFARALAEEDRGNVPQAIALYKASLAQLPTYEPAQRKLSRLQRPA